VVMRMFGMVAFAAVTLGGCAGTQLAYNTVDVSSTVESIYTNQTLLNLSRTIDDPWAIPSMLEITTGQIGTSNSVSPSFTTPLSKSAVRDNSGTISTVTRAGLGLTIGANDGWQQSWNTLPVTNPKALRKLRALYRGAVARNGGCEPRATPILRTKCGWVFWSGLRGSYLPADGSPVKSLGVYGGNELFIKQVDANSGVLQEFVLAVMAADDEEKSSAGATKKAVTTIQRLMPPPKVE
jgi:hypothetical protein